jgi:hypothetical protein
MRRPVSVKSVFLGNWVGKPLSENAGGLNGSTQHLLKVFLSESTRLISLAGVDSIKTKPCLGSE